MTTAAAVGRQTLPAQASTMHGLVATPIGDPAVYTAPDTRSRSIPIGRVNNLGIATVFAIIGDDRDAWTEVLLPTRPNGAIGWVERSRVRVTSTDLRLSINLGSRRLTLKRADQTLLQVAIATGTVTNPTPTGATYVTELLDTGKPNGTYGRYAYGLALHSNTLSEFGGGDGQVGIHGTNAPKLIGQRVSHGCVRLNNADVRRLVYLGVPIGTPVFVT